MEWVQGLEIRLHLLMLVVVREEWELGLALGWVESLVAVVEERGLV